MSTPTPSTSRVPAEALVALAVLGMLAILVVPVPALAMDLLLALSIAMAVLMLLVALGLKRAMEFSVFPSLLLITTLFRLSLNVATTRLILLRGSEGAAAAGHVVEAFGHFAVGGSLIVGAVIFLILLVVNFAVITKGSGRISEVAARFTLDALPGKQMAIDADLAAGIINDRDARARRAALEQETEFFGAMDGASKFVRGDAIAGLAITAINILGGLAAGLLRDHMTLAAAAENYTVLTVGDGLVSQLPALLISTAAGIVVTRAAGAELGSQIGGQIFGRSRVLMYTAAVLGLIALLPGIPLFSFGSLAAGVFILGRRAARAEESPTAAAPKQAPKGEERVQDLLAVDALELELGYGLLRLIDIEKAGELPGRVTALRKQLATDLGIILPSVHLRDNLRLEPNEYRVNLRGLQIGSGTVYLDRLMALDPTGKAPGVEGIQGREPAFGLPATWVLSSERSSAERLGLTLVDPASVMTTHLAEVIRRNAFELVGRQEVQELLAVCAKEAPKLVEDTVPGTVTLGELVRVVRGLLREGISVRDFRTVLEGVADAAPRSKDTTYLVEQVRKRFARQITARVADGKTQIVHALTLERGTEESLRASLGNSDGEATLAPDVETARKLIAALETQASGQAAAGYPATLLAPPDLRKPLFDFASRFVPDLWVVSARELSAGVSVQPFSVIQLSPPSGLPRGEKR